MRSPVGQVFFRRLLRLALAAALLWYDVRLFYLYVFLTVLRSLDDTDRLRATLRLYQVSADVRWLTLLRHVGVTQQEMDDAAQGIQEAQHEAYLENMVRDCALVVGRPVETKELFKLARGMGDSLLASQSNN